MTRTSPYSPAWRKSSERRKALDDAAFLKRISDMSLIELERMYLNNSGKNSQHWKRCAIRRAIGRLDPSRPKEWVMGLHEWRPDEMFDFKVTILQHTIDRVRSGL